MPLTFRPVPNGCVQPGPSPSADRVQHALIGGVAVLAAGLLVAGPSAPGLPEVQVRAVKLTSVDPTTVFSTAENNLQVLISQLQADPNPVGDALSTIGQGYENTITTSLQGAQTGLEHAIDGYTSASGHVHEGLAMTLQTIENYVQQGDLFDAYATYDYYSLESLEGLTKPLGAILAIPGDISQHFTNVLDSTLTFGTGEGLLEGFTAPLITATVEATQVFDGIEAAVSAGNAATALTDITNAPTEVLGAFLNGDYFDFGQGRGAQEFPGLLSFATGTNAEAGGLQELLITLPQQLAAALNESTTASTAESIAGGLTNLLGVDGLADITAALDPSSLLDPVGPLDLVGSLLGSL